DRGCGAGASVGVIPRGRRASMTLYRALTREREEGCGLAPPFASQARHPMSAAPSFRQARTSPMNIDLSGKTALVTGSTGGIGFAIVAGLAACGARVAVNGRKQETVDAALAR